MKRIIISAIILISSLMIVWVPMLYMYLFPENNQIEPIELKSGQIWKQKVNDQFYILWEIKTIDARAVYLTRKDGSNEWVYHNEFFDDYVLIIENK